MRCASELHDIHHAHLNLSAGLLLDKGCISGNLRLRQGCYIFTTKRDYTALHLADTADQSQQAGLSRTIWPKQSKRRARCSIKGNTIDDETATRGPMNIFQ
ncbi:hypothetical protein D3C80_1912960 [compost metagenome]